MSFRDRKEKKNARRCQEGGRPRAPATARSGGLLAPTTKDGEAKDQAMICLRITPRGTLSTS